MGRMLPVLRTVAFFVVLGVVAPIVALAFLCGRHEPPYVLERAAMTSARAALGGAPVSLVPVTGVLDTLGDGGTIARYADGSTSAIVRAARPDQVIERYGGSLRESRSH